MLELTDVSFAYGDKTVLHDVAFTVGRGEIVGFVGENGAGKTTTMRLIMGLLEPATGSMTWHGRPIDTAVRESFGYMPEERGLYPKMKVLDQLVYLAELHGLGDNEASTAATECLTRLGLDHYRSARVEALSLGNQQRVQLGAALVHHPDLLVLDEPFSGLDPIGTDLLSDVLRTEARDRKAAILFSSHQLELVEMLCDAVVIIRSGAITVAGSRDQLLQQVGRTLRVHYSSESALKRFLGLCDAPVLESDDHVAVLAISGLRSTADLMRVALESGEVEDFVIEQRSLSSALRRYLTA